MRLPVQVRFGKASPFSKNWYSPVDGVEEVAVVGVVADGTDRVVEKNRVEIDEDKGRKRWRNDMWFVLKEEGEGKRKTKTWRPRPSSVTFFLKRRLKDGVGIFSFDRSTLFVCG